MGDAMVYRSARRALSRRRVRAPVAGKSQKSPEADLKRIDEIIKNARATWFALLGALVFAAVTLASVKDVTFFASDVQTKLPLANISVPVVSFFWAGALLIAALYIYFHLYLEQLWDALGEAPARVNGKPSADCIHPWLVSDTALRVRDWLRTKRETSPYVNGKGIKIRIAHFRWFWRGYLRSVRASLARWISEEQHRPLAKPSSKQRGMTWVSNIISVALVWFFGLAVIFWFWWRSMPAQNPTLSGWLLIILVFTAWVFWNSACSALCKLAGNPRKVRQRSGFIGLVFAATIITVFRSGMPFYHLEGEGWTVPPTKDWPVVFRVASADLSDFAFTKKPDGWQIKEVQAADFATQWCKNQTEGQKVSVCDTFNTTSDITRYGEGKRNRRFRRDWDKRWESVLGSLKKSGFQDRALQGANFKDSQMEGINLRYSDAGHADFFRSNLDNADMRWGSFHHASFRRANLFHARMKEANFTYANFSRADMWGANLKDADLRHAFLKGARFSYARLNDAKLQGAVLIGANEESHYGGSEERSVLRSEFLNGANFSGAWLRNIRFEVSRKSNEYVDNESLENTIGLDSSFADGSVETPDGFKRPAHWCSQVLSDKVYFGHLRAWLGERAETLLTGEEIRQYPEIHEGSPCPKWQRRRKIL